MTEQTKTHIISLAWASIVSVLLFAGYVLANSAAQPGLATLPGPFNDNAQRPCIYPPGGWTTIDSDNSGANLSAELNDWTTYAIQCDDDAYFAPGTSAAAADSGDGWLSAGSIVRFTTDASSVYVSVLNKSHATADCHYIECR